MTFDRKCAKSLVIITNILHFQSKIQLCILYIIKVLSKYLYTWTGGWSYWDDSLQFGYKGEYLTHRHDNRKIARSQSERAVLCLIFNWPD